MRHGTRSIVGAATRAAALLAVILAPLAAATEQDHWELWLTGGLDHRATLQTRLRVDWEEYRGDDMSDLYYTHVEVGVYQGIRPWLETSLCIREVQEKKSGSWQEEVRPHANAEFIIRTRNAVARDRVRIEFRDREDAHDMWRARNRVRIELPPLVKRLSLRPYVCDEIYVDSYDREFNQNRVSVGLSSALGPRLKGELYVLRKSTRKDGDWTDVNVLGAVLRATF